MRAKQHQNFLNTTFALARLIAIGLIIIGVVTFFWPVECSNGFVVVGCAVAHVVQAFIGISMIIPGIIILVLLAMSNSRHRNLKMIGIFANFLAAILIIVVLLPFLSDFIPFNFAMLSDYNYQFPLIIIIIGVFEILGFLCAGLFMIIKQRIIYQPSPNQLPDKA